ncbi:MAG: hypothetical protein IIB80_00020 [Thaumarchaeota archaeon]|nr:hypothetical protein [Nitrososphaerota archaeon]
MVLDETFQKKISSLIDKTLKSNEIKSPELEEKIWGYEAYNDNFKYGHKAGFLLGIIIGNYLNTYSKCPDNDELLEIRKIVEERLDEIKNSVLDQYFFHKF